MKGLLRVAIRAAFYPTLGYARAMERLGRWRRWDWVDPDVLLGAMPSRADMGRLKAMGVGAVVNLCDEFAGHVEALAERGMEQLHVPVLDYHSPQEADVLAGLRFMVHQIGAGRKVYVHCKAGRGRSATLAVCYLMVSAHLSAKQAHQTVQAARPQVNGGLAERPVVQAVERLIQAQVLGL